MKQVLKNEEVLSQKFVFRHGLREDAITMKQKNVRTFIYFFFFKSLHVNVIISFNN